MKDLKINSAIIASVLSLACSIALFFYSDGERKIAYVRSNDLVYGYQGMKEAQIKFQRQSDAWKANIDTLQANYQLAVSRYTSQAAELSKEERMAREKQLHDQQQQLMGYSQAINTKAKEEDDRITQGVLNQINAFVEEYGKEQGYDVILGTTLSGSLLYGQEQIDITSEVLEALNTNYKGQGPGNGK